MLTAITTNSRETGRKLSGPLTSGETPMSPNAPSATPCSAKSHELSRPEHQCRNNRARSRCNCEHLHIPNCARQIESAQTQRWVHHQKVHSCVRRVKDAANCQQPPGARQRSAQDPPPIPCKCSEFIIAPPARLWPLGVSFPLPGGNPTGGQCTTTPFHDPQPNGGVWPA